jgi:hypothetical protein
MKPEWAILPIFQKTLSFKKIKNNLVLPLRTDSMKVYSYSLVNGIKLIFIYESQITLSTHNFTAMLICLLLPVGYWN